MRFVEFVKDDRGAASYVWLLIILIIAIVILSFSLEIYQAFTVKDKITVLFERAGNMAVSFSMRDEYRMEKMQRIDTYKARTMFLEYIEDGLGLTGNYPSYVYDNGSLKYDLVFSELRITEEPPLIESVAEVAMRPATSARWIPESIKISLPIKSRSRNVRVAD